MNVAKISEQKAQSLEGKEFQQHKKYNPVQDANGNWIVSLIEAQYLPILDFQVIEFVPQEVAPDAMG